MVGSENLQRMADVAFNAGALKDNSVESYVKSLSQKVDTASGDGKAMSIITDSQGKIIGRTESKHTKDGVETNWFAEGKKEPIKHDLNGDNVDSHKQLKDNSVSDIASILIDRSYLEKMSTTRDYTVENINPTGFHIAEELTKMNAVARSQFLNYAIGIDATKEVLKNTTFLGTNVSGLVNIESNGAKEVENVLLDVKNNIGYNQVPGNKEYDKETALTNRESQIEMKNFTKFVTTKPNLPTNYKNQEE